MRKALYILGDLDDRDIVWLSDNGELVELDAGEVLLAAGQSVQHLYFLTAGALAVERPDGTPIATLGVGEVIGEMSFVEKRPPEVSVRAGETSRLLQVPRERLLGAFARDQGFAARFYRALAVFLSDRLRSATQGGRAGAAAADDELDEGILDTLHVAGDRMLRLIDVLEGRSRA